MLLAIFKKEYLENSRNFSSIISSVAFFLLSLAIFAFIADVNNNLVSNIAIANIWILILFTILFSSGDSFKKDFEDGNFEQFFLSGNHLELIILAKIFSNWCFKILPLIISLPVALAILKVDLQICLALIVNALITTFILALIIAFSDALTLAINKNSAFLLLLILPVILPILIFANSALLNFGQNNFYELFLSNIGFLVAILVFLLPIFTIAIAQILKINLRS